MALTNAERQARWQQRRKDRTQRLEAEILDLRQQLAQAQHEIEMLRGQLDEAMAPKPKPAPKRRGDPLARFLYPTLRRQR
jgi:predicted RNase H-like nuclease (RuvC/YqgF family)